jgi:hypothetical protein
MPVKPRREQRVAWHAEHALVCGCREVPESLKSEVEAAKRRLESRGPGPERSAAAEPSAKTNGNES